MEASSRCQLRCPSCPTTTKAIDPAVGSGVLKLADFERFIDSNPSVRKIELSNYGEVFLNPDLLSILRLAHQNGITVNISNGANLNHVSDEVLEALVLYRVENMTCSIDGASQETYAQYRVRGNFDRVIENVRKLNNYKAAHRTPFPRLKWQFIVFGHNEHEIPRVKELARELDMEMFFKLTWDSSFSPLRNVEWIKSQTGLTVASREEYAEKNGADYKSEICRQLWNEPQINWDGKNLGCGRNFWGDFGGNAFMDGLLAVLNHPKIRYARQMLQGARPPREDIPCTTCDIYQGMRARGQWVEPDAPVDNVLWHNLKLLGEEQLRRTAKFLPERARAPVLSWLKRKAGDGRSINKFPAQDKAWMEIVHFLRPRVLPGETIFAPTEFSEFFDSVFYLPQLGLTSLPGADWVVFHKGWTRQIDLEVLLGLKEKFDPLFANGVFVVLHGKESEKKVETSTYFRPSADRSLSEAKELPDKTHVEVIWARMAEMEARQTALPRHARTAIIVTTYNRPWALARSLPQILASGCPVLVIDDGSELSYEREYKEVLEKNRHPLLTHQKLPINRGLCGAMNVALSYWLADPEIEWISCFQDDVDIKPDLFDTLEKVQEERERPLLVGYYPWRETPFGAATINGVAVHYFQNASGQHFHGHRNYWQGLMPIPTIQLGAPKPGLGSGVTWWITAGAAKSVSKRGLKVISIPGMVETFAKTPELSTWHNTSA